MKFCYLKRGIGLGLAPLLVAGTYASVGLGQDNNIQKPSEKIQMISDQAQEKKNEAKDGGESAVEKGQKEIRQEADEKRQNLENKRKELMDRREELKSVGKQIQPKPRTDKEADTKYAVIGMGKTLPEGVLRVRFPFISTYGKEGFDDNGDRKDLGVEINVKATALVAEYGINDKVSLQILAPYVMSNRMGLNANNVRANNHLFRREMARYKNAVAGLLHRRGQCTTLESCHNLIENPNFTLPAQEEITLTTGEKAIAYPDEPALVQIDRLIMNAMRPIAGETGIGDLQIGGLYNFYANNMLSMSLGLGLRLPTGAFKDVPRGRRAIGGGVTDFGARFNLDFQPVRSVVLSAQYQAEQMLVKGKRNKTSALYNNRLNTGDPTDEAAIAIGSDGKGNNQDFERVGVGHNWVLRVGYGLGDLGKYFQPVGINASYNYSKGRETRYDGSAFDGIGLRYDLIPTSTSYTVGISWDGLNNTKLIPVTVSVDYTSFISGENMVVAPDSTTVQLIGYYKF